MHIYTLEEARRISMNCAKQYSRNLLGKKYLIIYKDRTDNLIKHLEIQFDKSNYQHLTGLELIDSHGNTRKNVASLFFSKCLNNTLKKEEIRFKSDGPPLKAPCTPCDDGHSKGYKDSWELQ